ncbi:MAG: hypothetical protein ACJAZ9_002105, partial [Neolewinella sp.]
LLHPVANGLRAITVNGTEVFRISVVYQNATKVKQAGEPGDKANNVEGFGEENEASVHIAKVVVEKVWPVRRRSIYCRLILGKTNVINTASISLLLR